MFALIRRRPPAAPPPPPSPPAAPRAATLPIRTEVRRADASRAVARENARLPEEFARWGRSLRPAEGEALATYRSPAGAGINRAMREGDLPAAIGATVEPLRAALMRATVPHELTVLRGAAPAELVRYAARQQTLDRACRDHPERFVNQPPKPPHKPTVTWINPPARTTDHQA